MPTASRPAPRQTTAPSVPKSLRDSWLLAALERERVIAPASLEALRKEAPEWVGAAVVTKGLVSEELVAALASGQGPALVIMPHDLLVSQGDKLTPIPFSIVSERAFLDTYLDGASVFLSNNGILALPILVDPVVMYWNKDLFASAGIPTPWSSRLESL